MLRRRKWLGVACFGVALLLGSCGCAARRTPTGSEQSATLESEGLIRIGSDALEAQLIAPVSPVYPEAALRIRQQGIVVTEVVVDPQGNVSAVRVVTGAPRLRTAAIVAVAQQKYVPFLLNGAPVSVSSTAAVEFRLPDADRSVPEN